MVWWLGDLWLRLLSNVPERYLLSKVRDRKRVCSLIGERERLTTDEGSLYHKVGLRRRGSGVLEGTKGCAFELQVCKAGVDDVAGS